MPRKRIANDNGDSVGPYGRNFIRAWREDRQHTQQSLAAVIGTSKGYISQWETGQRRVSSMWLKRIADELHCTPGDLLSTNPDNLPEDIRTLWLRASPQQRLQIVALAEQVLKYGT